MVSYEEAGQRSSSPESVPGSWSPVSTSVPSLSSWANAQPQLHLHTRTSEMCKEPTQLATLVPFKPSSLHTC